MPSSKLIIDLTDGEEALTEEQEALDNHDDQVSELKSVFRDWYHR